tara:strand:- start:268 stop:369 length:102 start_codon:yes stop_codon:yes gene_type:complete
MVMAVVVEVVVVAHKSREQDHCNRKIEYSSQVF